MRLTLALAALSAVSIAACEPTTTVEAGAPDAPATGSANGDEAAAGGETPAPAAALGGVDLTGAISTLGTEPFWAVTFEGDEMVYSGVDRPEQRAPRPEPVIHGTTAAWTTRTAAGNDLVVTLIETECSDGMSDRTYPLTARVEIAGEDLNGCAASTEWIHSVGEDGQPREG